MLFEAYGQEWIISFRKCEKECAQSLTLPLTKIFNKCIMCSTFPLCWKSSKVVPIFKDGDKSEIKNYRPIAIINNFAKALEKIIHFQLYLQTNCLFSKNQHGFLPGRSTVSNLFLISQHIAFSLDHRDQTDVVYLDFAKAFDCLDHKVLHKKLLKFGLSVDFANFLKSYLENRKFYVEIAGTQSKTFLITSGVPQGSVLGPILFNIFINDIVDIFKSTALLYADDLKIFSNVVSLEDCYKIQKDLMSLENWCNDNRLLLNIEKCKIVSFSRNKSKIIFEYKIQNRLLQRTHSVKDLGVIFDDKLTYVLHCQSVVNASYKMLGFIIRSCKEFKEVGTFKLLFTSLVRSKLEYAAIIWRPYYKTHIDTIERIQRRFLKFLFFKTNGVYPMIGYPHQTLLDLFQCVSFEDRINVASLKFFYKIAHNFIDCPDILYV